MFIHAALECIGCVRTEAGREELSTARVLEAREVVHEAVDDNERALFALGNKVSPADYREMLRRLGPVHLASSLMRLGELHDEPALLYLILRELLEVRGQAELRHGPDEPLGWVVLVPEDGVAVVHGEFVVEVVVALADGDKSSDPVVAGRRLAVIRGVAKVVGERVDGESGVVHKDKAADACIEKGTADVVPQVADEGGEDETEEEHDREVVLVLEADDRVVVEVRDADRTGTAARLEDHPADMSPEEAGVCAVRVEVSVGVAVVRAVTTGPPAGGALDGA